MRSIFLIFSLFVGLFSYSQNLSGCLWHVDSIVGADYGERYEFGDRSYTYYISAFESLSTIKALKGDYKIDNDTICFYPQELEVYIPIGFECGPPTGTHGAWSAIIKEKQIVKIDSQPVSLPFVFNDDSIKINGKLFFKIADK